MSAERVAERIAALSGVVQPEANAPYVHWLERVCRRLREDGRPAGPIEAAMLDADDAAQWQEWLPAHGLWLPFDTAPAALPAEANTSGTAENRLAAERDYHFVLDQLGACPRTRCRRA